MLETMSGDNSSLQQLENSPNPTNTTNNTPTGVSSEVYGSFPLPVETHQFRPVITRVYSNTANKPQVSLKSPPPAENSIAAAIMNRPSNEDHYAEMPSIKPSSSRPSSSPAILLPQPSTAKNPISEESHYAEFRVSSNLPPRPVSEVRPPLSSLRPKSPLPQAETEYGQFQELEPSARKVQFQLQPPVDQPETMVEQQFVSLQDQGEQYRQQQFQLFQHELQMILQVPPPITPIPVYQPQLQYLTQDQQIILLQHQLQLLQLQELQLQQLQQQTHQHLEYVQIQLQQLQVPLQVQQIHHQLQQVPQPIQQEAPQQFIQVSPQTQRQAPQGPQSIQQEVLLSLQRQAPQQVLQQPMVQQRPQVPVQQVQVPQLKQPLQQQVQQPQMSEYQRVVVQAEQPLQAQPFHVPPAKPLPPKPKVMTPSVKLSSPEVEQPPSSTTPLKEPSPGSVPLKEALMKLKDKVTEAFHPEKVEETPEETVNRKVEEMTLGNLDELDLSALDLVEMPERVSRECALRAVNLQLDFNRFTTFPQLQRFAKLEILHLSGNKLNVLPPEIGVLTKLTELYLNGNRLLSIPVEITRLTKLEKLALQHNMIKSLLPEIGKLTGLEELILSGNPIKTLPKTIGKCVKLNTLELDGCELTQLPEELVLVSCLIELNLGNNQLKELPQGMGYLTRLTVLNLMDNQLGDLPISLGMCSGLGRIGSGINIARNPIRSAEMLKSYAVGPDKLLDFLEQRMRDTIHWRMPPLPTFEEKVQEEPKAPPKPTMNEEQRQLVLKKMATLCDWGTTHIDDVKNAFLEMKQQISQGKTIDIITPLIGKVDLAFAELEKAREILPKFRVVNDSAVTGTDPLTDMKAISENKIYTINIALSSMKRELATPKETDQLDTLVAQIKFLRAVQGLMV